MVKYGRQTFLEVVSQFIDSLRILLVRDSMAEGKFMIRRAKTDTSKSRKKVAIIGVIVAAGAVVVARLAPIVVDLAFSKRGRHTDDDAAMAQNGDDQSVRDLGAK